MSPPFKVIVVGGGLSGALLANGLQNNNVEFKVYERDTKDSAREGYQIRLGESAMSGFRACLDKERMNAIAQRLGQSSGSTATAPTLVNTRFEQVIDLNILPTYAKSAAINRVVLRDMLTEPIKKSGRIEYEKAFQRYEIIQDSGRETVKVHFADGSSDSCDILVAADGSGSRINKQVGANNIVSLDSHIAFVAKGDLPLERLDHIPRRLQEGPVMCFNGGSSFYYALYLPSSAQPDVNQTNSTKAQVSYDTKLASFYWGLTIKREEIPYDQVSDIPDARKMCISKLREWEWAQDLQDLVTVGSNDEGASVTALKFRASTPLPKNWRSQIQARAHTPEEGHPRVWLLGDAVHAMQPNRGQGGNQAMCDTAEMLPELLRLNDIALSNKRTTTQDVTGACRVYEDKMFDRAFPWVKKSGGTSFPTVDFDGALGTLLKFMSYTVLPVVKFFARLLSRNG
ncbi:FAD/NAD(P)-binding domain-containing protein [Plenodomus tracheiphilus IPT5]|uniref:FAD/NAD(P)-binding domain-containing protein n=1 Tax=Plenodomus tracheiphilus IPT5 TaxID=1408161 RepID=A0A6A7B8V1_9PLEO|nr:FAD/NAD(P)-binding domain-containing protein [Plenodomus tracheiphilus IPT5]